MPPTSLQSLTFSKLLKLASPDQIKNIPSPIREQFTRKIASATRRYKQRKEANTRKCQEDNINKLKTKEDLIGCILLSAPDFYKHFIPGAIEEKDMRRPRGLITAKLRGDKDPHYQIKMQDDFIPYLELRFLPKTMRFTLGQFKRIIDILFTNYYKKLFPIHYAGLLDTIRHGQHIRTIKHHIDSNDKIIKINPRAKSDEVQSISKEKMIKFIKEIINKLPSFLKKEENIKRVEEYQNRLSATEKPEFDRWLENWQILNRDWSKEASPKFITTFHRTKKMSFKQVIKFFEVLNFTQLQEIIVNTRENVITYGALAQGIRKSRKPKRPKSRKPKRPKS
jgi:hypothetical protein